MLFNSISFAIFLPVVFFLYWFVTKSLKYQNILLLIASYFFYACWDWRFMFLLIFSTFLDYYTGIKIEENETAAKKKFWFWLSISVNLCFLGFFKYYNFFVTSFTEALEQLNLHVNPWTIKVILPIGISFYTFHGLSYVIDIYKNRIKAEKDFINYSVFVSFFPLLVAGPIERATHLLPQIKTSRSFNYNEAVDGMKQILWGLFKKIVIADQCAEYSNLIFNNSDNYSGSTLFIGAVFFTFQIYGDFSGYSDIALGTAKLFGINLLRNFSYPYFSRDIAEFWRRWHISLSSWFKDYLYIPLGGSKGGNLKKIRNTFIIFIVSGFWHGANWTFIIWGMLNAIFIMPSIVFKTNRNYLNIVAEDRTFPNFREFFSMSITFLFTIFAWIFFRSDTITQAISIFRKIFSKSFLKIPNFEGIGLSIPLFATILVFLLIEWKGRREQFAISNVFVGNSAIYRWTFYLLLIIMILTNVGVEQKFIYFQF